MEKKIEIELMQEGVLDWDLWRQEFAIGQRKRLYSEKISNKKAL